MRRRDLLVLTLTTLFLLVSFWRIDGRPSLAASPSFTWHEPQTNEPKDVEDKLQATLLKEKPNTLIVGNDKGEIVATYDTKDLRKKGYKSLSDFLVHSESATDKKECKKISSKCRKCPNGKIYCTNDAQFASGSRD